MPNDITLIHDSIRKATTRDLHYLHQLQLHWKKNLGYLHKAILQDVIDRGYAWLVNENTQAAGYILLYPRRSGILRVIQLAIDPELLRTTLGTQVMHTLSSAAGARGAPAKRQETRQNNPPQQFLPKQRFIKKHTTTTTNPKQPLKLEWTLPIVNAITNQGKQAHSSKKEKK